MFGCCKLKKLTVLAICLCIVMGVCGVIAAASYEENTDADTNGIFVPIIMYHGIVDSRVPCGDYRVSTETVESDLAYLKSSGYTSVFVEEIADYVNNGTPLPDNPVVITCDDGFYNNLYYLLPLLEKYNMKATVSIVGYYSEVLAAKDPHNPCYSYLTWEDVKELDKSGRIEIGNHTYNMHSLGERRGCEKLSYETEEEYEKVFNEDVGLMQTVTKLNTGILPTVFTYPFGIMSEESEPLIKKLGFCAALNCSEKPNYITHEESCLFSLNRYNRPDGISTEEFMERALAH